MSEYKRVVLVTGSNTGIGYELVRILAEKGHTVYLSARDESKGRESQQKLKREHNLAVKFVHLDITVSETILAAKDLIERSEGRLDILVNNAGGTDFLTPPQNVAGWDVAVAETVFNTNYFAVVQVTSTLLPLIRKAKSGYGVILNVSSTTASNTLYSQGRLNTAGYSATRAALNPYTVAQYSAAKSALNSFTISLSHMLQPEGIKVNCATPGLAASNLTNFTSAGRSAAAAAEVLLPWVLLGPEDTDKHAKFGGPPEYVQPSGEMLW